MRPNHVFAGAGTLVEDRGFPVLRLFQHQHAEVTVYLENKLCFTAKPQYNREINPQWRLDWQVSASDERQSHPG